MPTPTPLARQIDRRRKKLGLSVAALARASGVRRETLAYWLLGHRGFDADTLPAVLREIGMQISAKPRLGASQRSRRATS